MTISEFFKKMFPKIVMPKRYIAAIGIIAYVVCKIYVLHTPNPNDDNVPDQLRGMIINLADDSSPPVVYGEIE